MNRNKFGLLYVAIVSALTLTLCAGLPKAYAAAFTSTVVCEGTITNGNSTVPSGHFTELSGSLIPKGGLDVKHNCLSTQAQGTLVVDAGCGSDPCVIPLGSTSTIPFSLKAGAVIGGACIQTSGPNAGKPEVLGTATITVTSGPLAGCQSAYIISPFSKLAGAFLFQITPTLAATSGGTCAAAGVTGVATCSAFPR